MAKERPQEESGVRKNSICPSRCCGLKIPGPTVHLAGFPGASMLRIPGHLSRAATWGVPHAPFPSRSILALGCFLGFFEREALKNLCSAWLRTSSHPERPVLSVSDDLQERVFSSVPSLLKPWRIVFVPDCKLRGLKEVESASAFKTTIQGDYC